MQVNSAVRYSVFSPSPVTFQSITREYQSVMDPIKYDRTSECALILVTSLYTASLFVSAQFRNNYSWIKSCHPFIPFGECIISDGALKDTWLQYLISFVVALLAGMYLVAQICKRECVCTKSK